MEHLTQCMGCKAFITGEDLADRKPCEGCESVARAISIDVSQTLGLHQMLKTAQRRPGVSGGPIVSDWNGDEYTRRTGRFSQKQRLIDRLNDRYFEIVVDSETGEVLHHCEEKLSEHKGHGSARTKESR